MQQATRKFALRCSTAGLGLFAFGTLLLLPSHQLPLASAAESSAVIRVEEDWKLVLNEPGSDINAPQFHTLMSPFGDAETAFAQVTWNYRDVPEFAAGGLQLQAWNEDDWLDELSVGENSLSCDAETITWTQRLDISNGPLTFKIVNGRSQSWGTFGGWGVSIRVDAGVANLAGYSPLVSKDNSCVTFGANRVSTLMITEVRRYHTDGTMSTDTSPIVVFRYRSVTEAD